MDQEIEEICSELGRLPDEAGRRDFLDRRPQLVSLKVVKQLTEAVRGAVRVDVRKALDLAEAALVIARELKTSEALALGSRAKANALWLVGECKSAVGLFHEAATLFQQAGNMNELARTLSSSLQALSLLGEYDEAFAAAETAQRSSRVSERAGVSRAWTSMSRTSITARTATLRHSPLTNEPIAS